MIRDDRDNSSPASAVGDSELLERLALQHVRALSEQAPGSARRPTPAPVDLPEELPVQAALDAPATESGRPEGEGPTSVGPPSRGERATDPPAGEDSNFAIACQVLLAVLGLCLGGLLWWWVIR